jgi:hypothetical protein
MKATKAEIAEHKKYAQERIDKWALNEEIALGTGLREDAAWCAYRQTQWVELLECLDELDRVAA